MPSAPTPLWVWLFVLVAMVPPILALFALFIRERFIEQPLRRISYGDLTVELWFREWNRAPKADAIVVPVAPDLKMATGIAKWVKDCTANRIQREAESAAPLKPGEAFAGSGGKYRFGAAALAVVMDETKRTTPEWITGGVARAIDLAARHDARIILLPDMTEDLLRQPNAITDQQRRETARPVAQALLDAVVMSRGIVDEVRIFVWNRTNEEIYIQEMDRLSQAADHGDLLPAAAH